MARPFCMLTFRRGKDGVHRHYMYDLKCGQCPGLRAQLWYHIAPVTPGQWRIELGELHWHKKVSVRHRTWLPRWSIPVESMKRARFIAQRDSEENHR